MDCDSKASDDLRKQSVVLSKQVKVIFISDVFVVVVVVFVNLDVTLIFILTLLVIVITSTENFIQGGGGGECE